MKAEVREHSGGNCGKHCDVSSGSARIAILQCEKGAPVRAPFIDLLVDSSQAIISQSSSASRKPICGLCWLTALLAHFTPS